MPLYICLQAVINYGATWYDHPFDMEIDYMHTQEHKLFDKCPQLQSKVDLAKTVDDTRIPFHSVLFCYGT